MSEKRLIGDYPVIGIRPIIDARKGILDVRGSLEGQTMAMAQAAKQLLESTAAGSESAAAAVGYGNNPKYFTKVFKKYTGYTPTEYKQLYGRRV